MMHLLQFSHGGHVAPVNDFSWNAEGIASLDKVRFSGVHVYMVTE